MSFRYKAIISSSGVYCAVFSILFVFHLHKGFDTDFMGVNIWSKTSDVARVWVGGSDNQVVFQAAYSWYESGILKDPGWIWVTNLWPPGMTIIQYILIRVIGESGRFVFILVALNSALWAAVFLQIFRSAKSRNHKVVVIVGSFYLLSSWIFEDWLMGPWFSLSSGFAIPFFLLGFLRLGENSSWLFSSSMIAISALTRVTSYLMIQLVFATGVLLLAYSFIKPIWMRKNSRIKSDTDSNSVRTNGLRILLVTIVPIVLILGWTEYVTRVAHPDNRAYTISDPGMIHGMRWRTSDDINSVGGNFVVVGTGNWACVISPVQCADIAKKEKDTNSPYSGNGYYSGDQLRNMAIKALVGNPVSYLQYRLPSFWEAWSNGNLIFGLLISVSFLISTLHAASEIFKKISIQSVIFLSFIGVNVFPLFWIHLQLNYLIPIQLVSACYLMFNYEKIRLAVGETREFRSSVREKI